MVTNCEARTSSTVATQSLMLMNGDFWLSQAAALADRAQREPAKNIPPDLIAELPQRWETSPPIWQFGYGSFDAASGRTVAFNPFPHSTGSSWQGGEKVPDDRVGWALLHADGGHPGNNPDFAVIRRWTAPADGALTIRGALVHQSPNGDGVRGSMIVSSLGTAGAWDAHNGEAATNVEKLAVKEGDTIDFITDCREHVTSDSFTWRVEITLTPTEGDAITFRSNEGFRGPLPQSAAVELASIAQAWQLAYSRLPTREELHSAANFLTAQRRHLRLHPQNIAASRTPETQSLANLCHALLSSNEFLYVD
jgi:hypothetical protein